MKIAILIGLLILVPVAFALSDVLDRQNILEPEKPVLPIIQMPPIEESPWEKEQKEPEPILYEDNVVKSTRAACTSGAPPTEDCDIMGDITFPPGTYYINNGMNVLADDVTIDCSGATLVGPGYNHGMEIHNRNNVVVQNCNFQDYGTAIWILNTTQISITNSRAYESSTAGISASNVQDITIDGFTQRNSTGSGILLFDSRGISIINSNFLGFATAQIRTSKTCDARIINNTFFDITSRAMWIDNEVYSGDEPVTADPDACEYLYRIENNTVNKAFRGMTYWKIDPSYRHLASLFKGNHFEEIRAGAIYMTYIYEPIKITQNTFLHNQWYEVAMMQNVNNIEVFGNTGQDGVIGSYPVHGIYSHENFPGYKNISIHNNEFSGYQGGIFLNEIKDFDIYENDLHNNEFGMSVYYASNVTIHSNSLYDNNVGFQYEGDRTDIWFYLNNLYNNFAINMEARTPHHAPWELSLSGKGNYWGHTEPPCYNAAVDQWFGSVTLVTDSYPTCTPNSGADMTLYLNNPYSWYFFSYDVNPAIDAPGAIFSYVQFVVQFVKSFFNGAPEVWYSDDPWGSTLEHMDFEKGYWMKVWSQTENPLIITGPPVSKCYDVTLLTGIHWIGYWGQEEQPIEVALQDIDGMYEWVKTFENEVPYTYDPAYPMLSDLKVMKPGNAYRIKMTDEASFNYCEPDP